MSALDYIHVTYGEPHAQRARQMLSAHPELRSLAGPAPSTALWVFALVAVQLALAIVTGRYRWFVWGGLGKRSFARYHAIGSARFIVPSR